MIGRERIGTQIAVGQSVSRSVGQSVSRSVGQSVSLLLLLVVLTFSLSAPADAQTCLSDTTRFVYAGIGDDTGHNGQCWEQAYATLDKALDDLNAEDSAVTTILIAQGTYTSSQTFHVHRGCTIRGGYAGAGQDPGAWDPSQFVTTLDGEGDRRVMELWTDFPPFDGDVELEGLVVTRGRAGSGQSGGGLFMNIDDPETTVLIKRCAFVENEAGGRGGAISDQGSSGGPELEVRESLFERNVVVLTGLASVSEGGAIAVAGPLTAVRCRFIENSAPKIGRGGAISAGYRPGDAFRLTLCEFRGNTAGSGAQHDDASGGAVCIRDDCALVGGEPCATCASLENETCEHAVLEATGCLFVGNTCWGGGGGAIGAYMASTSETPMQRGIAVLRHCTFAENSTRGDGCAVACRIVAAGNLIVYFNRIRPENPESVPTEVCAEQLIANDGDLTIAYSCVQDLDLGQFGDGNINGDPEFLGIPGCEYCLPRCSSPAVDAGSAALIPDDVTDVDENPVTTELPWDLLEDARVQGLVDMGAYETQGFGTCPPDFNDDGVVDGDDMGTLLGLWGTGGGYSIADFNCDGTVAGYDLGELLGYWGACDQFMMSGGGGITPQDAAEAFGFESVEEFVAWLSGLDFPTMSALLEGLFGN